MKAVDEQHEHIRTAREMLDEAVRYLNKSRSDIIGQLSREEDRYQTKPLGTPAKGKPVKGREASPYGYVLEDWKLPVAKYQIISPLKEHPDRQLVRVSNPLIGFSVGAIEFLKEEDFALLSELFEGVN